MLLDRSIERAALDDLLAGARSGRSGAVVLRGEPGIGKTALIEYAIDSAPDVSVLRIAGIESEMALGWAALHQLLLPLLPSIGGIPLPQQQAIKSAFGQTASGAPDPFAVGLATLALLSDFAAERPLLVAVDDVDWLDRESLGALGFVARRFPDNGLAMVFATRELDNSALARIPRLDLAGLPAEDAQDLLVATVGGPVDPAVFGRLFDETRGNPLGLIELSRQLTREQVSGRAPLPEFLPIGRGIEASFLGRIDRLSAATRTLLIVAAAEPGGDPALIWRAASILGVGPEAAVDRNLDPLIEFGPRVTFSHPLIRSAAYKSASTSERRRVHAALAEASDPAAAPDRRAWHRAAAAVGPDSEIATELEESSQRARERGGNAAAAVFLTRAAELTPDAVGRARRFLAAAHAHLAAGEPDKSRAMLDQAVVDLTTDSDLIASLRLEAKIRVASGDRTTVPQLLQEAARLAHGLHDVRLARDILFDAVVVSVREGTADRADLAAAVRAVGLPPGGGESVLDRLLDAFATRVAQGYEAAVSLLREAVAEACRSNDLRIFALAARAADGLDDDESRHAIAVRWIETSRRTGARDELSLALAELADVELAAGNLESAETALAEEQDIATALHGPRPGDSKAARASILAWTGPEPEARVAIDSLLADSADGDRIGAATRARRALMLLELGLGRYADALASFHAMANPTATTRGAAVLASAVEAATRADDPDTAVRALHSLERRVALTDTDLGRGVLDRARALLAPDMSADDLYRSAITQLELTRARPELARAHLLYGEWLRRHRMRLAARAHLRAALQMFESSGAIFFAERTRRELLATGEHARQRTVETLDALTPQEDRIARMAADGLSNPEMAAQLFITRSTVEYHLRKVYDKLGVNSRVQLANALPVANALPAPAFVQA